MSHHEHEGEDGHGSPQGMIPESSAQDKLLCALAFLTLLALIYSGCHWSFQAGGHESASSGAPFLEN